MRAVIFDMDGTILNTIDDIAGAVNYILGKYDMPLRTVDEVKSFVGNGLYKTLERSVPEGTDEGFIRQIYAEMVTYYKEHSNVHTRPYDGIVDAIGKIRTLGYSTAVVSNKRHEAVVDLCEVFFNGLFDVALGDQEGINIKPAPDMVDMALEKLGVSRDEAVYIGDSDVDILTARNSGLEGIFVSWGFRTPQFLTKHGAKIIVNTPEELIDAIVGR